MKGVTEFAPFPPKSCGRSRLYGLLFHRADFSLISASRNRRRILCMISRLIGVTPNIRKARVSYSAINAWAVRISPARAIQVYVCIQNAVAGHGKHAAFRISANFATKLIQPLFIHPHSQKAKIG